MSDELPDLPPLFTVLHLLFYLREPRARRLSAPRLDAMLRDASPRMVAALRWAKDHPNYRFETIVPDLRFSRAELHEYLCNMLATWEERWSNPYR